MSKRSRADRRRKSRTSPKREAGAFRHSVSIAAKGMFLPVNALVTVLHHCVSFLQGVVARTWWIIVTTIMAIGRFFRTSVLELYAGVGNMNALLSDWLKGIFPNLAYGLRWSLIIAFEFGVVIGTAIVLWKLHEPFLYQPLNVYDEGVTLMGAKRFAGGEVPYQDFFTIYGPLKFSVLGYVFQLFEASLIVARSFFIGVSLAAFLALLFFFRREGNLVYAALFTLLFLPFAQISLTPLFLVLIALWFSWQIHHPQSRFLPFAGGALLGLLFLLRIDFGSLTSLAVGALLFIWYLKGGASTQQLWSIYGKIAAAFLVVITPVFLLLSSAGALGDFWQQAVIFPLFGSYQELRHLPWMEISALQTAINGLTIDFLGLSSALVWFFWPIPFVIAAFYWLWRAIQHDFDVNGFLTNMLLGSFAAGAFLYASHRSDLGHVMFLNLLSLVFFLHLLTRFRSRLSGLLYLPLILVMLLFPAHTYLETLALSNMTEKKAYSFFGDATFFPSSPENDDLDRILNYFQGVDADAKVYVGVSDTSRVFVNNVMLPFLLRQPTATKYHELHTGIVTTAPVQAEMVDELQGVEYVVLWDMFECEPNLGCQSSGVNLVDEYIQSHFVLDETFGEYHIFTRQDLEFGADIE